MHILVGSGSSGIDACLGSALSSGKSLLVGINGFFGERLRTIAENYSLKVQTVECSPGSALQVDDFEAMLDNHPEVKAVAVVHLETFTTIIKPIEEIGKLARKHGLLFFVDAVSSLSDVPFKNGLLDDRSLRKCFVKISGCATRAFTYSDMEAWWGSN